MLPAVARTSVWFHARFSSLLEDDQQISRIASDNLFVAAIASMRTKRRPHAGNTDRSQSTRSRHGLCTCCRILPGIGTDFRSSVAIILYLY